MNTKHVSLLLFFYGSHTLDVIGGSRVVHHQHCHLDVPHLFENNPEFRRLVMSEVFKAMKTDNTVQQQTSKAVLQRVSDDFRLASLNTYQIATRPISYETALDAIEGYSIKLKFELNQQNGIKEY